MHNDIDTYPNKWKMHYQNNTVRTTSFIKMLFSVKANNPPYEAVQKTMHFENSINTENDI